MGQTGRGAEVRHIAVCGSYGGMNLGDEAILQVILRDLHARGPTDITVFSRVPADTTRRHGVRAVDVGGLSRQAARDIVAQQDFPLTDWHWT